MASYRIVAYDLLTSFKRVFDDADIRITQIIWWIQVVANRLRAEHYTLNNTGSFISTYSSVAVQVDNKGRPYIDLPVQILDLMNEKGVVYITYNEETCCCDGPPMAQVFFQPTKVSMLNRLYGDEYEKPSPSNPYFYRIGHQMDGVDVNRLYLLGTECIVVTDVELAVISALDPSQVCSLDDEIPLSPELIGILQKEILQLGRFVMMVPSERVNDGDDDAKASTAGVPQPMAQQQQTQQSDE